MRDITVEDFSRQYNESYFTLKNKDLAGVFTVLGVDRESSKVSLVNITDKKTYFVPLSELEIAPLPQSKLFEIDGSVLYYTKRCDRQWRRGFCSQTVYIENPINTLFRRSIVELWNTKAYKLMEGELRLPKFERLTAVLTAKKIYRPLDEAISELTGSVLSLILSDFLWVSLSPNSNTEYFIFYKHLLIARVERTAIEVICPAYKQELEDYLKRYVAKTHYKFI